VAGFIVSFVVEEIIPSEKDYYFLCANRNWKFWSGSYYDAILFLFLSRALVWPQCRVVGSFAFFSIFSRVYLFYSFVVRRALVTDFTGPDQLFPADSYVCTTATGAVKLKIDERGIGSIPPLSIPTLLQRTVSRHMDKPALCVKRDGQVNCFPLHSFTCCT